MPDLRGTERVCGDPADRGRDGLTGSQRVFMGWAQVWRMATRTEEQVRRLAIDPHSPPELRAGVVRNLDEFHDAFDVTEGDGMWLAEEERVRIW